MSGEMELKETPVFGKILDNHLKNKTNEFAFPYELVMSF